MPNLRSLLMLAAAALLAGCAAGSPLAPAGAAELDVRPARDEAPPPPPPPPSDGAARGPNTLGSGS